MSGFADLLEPNFTVLYAKEFIPPVIGPTGDLGPTGPKGVDGVGGLTGSTGHIGPTGPTGPTGTTGLSIAGSTGRTGAIGPQGQDGYDGLDGSTGPNGVTGTTGGGGPIESTAVIFTAEGNIVSQDFMGCVTLIDDELVNVTIPPLTVTGNGSSVQLIITGSPYEIDANTSAIYVQNISGTPVPSLLNYRSTGDILMGSNLVADDFPSFATPATLTSNAFSFTVMRGINSLTTPLTIMYPGGPDDIIILYYVSCNTLYVRIPYLTVDFDTMISISTQIPVHTSRTTQCIYVQYLDQQQNGELAFATYSSGGLITFYQDLEYTPITATGEQDILGSDSMFVFSLL